MAEGAVQIVVTDDLARSRVTVFFRLLLALPHLIMLGLLTAVALLLAPIAWVIALVTARVPDGLHEYFVTVVRYATHTYAYLYLAAQDWPPIAGARPYAIDVVLPPAPVRQNRWSVAFRGLLAVPAILLAGSLGTGVFTTTAYYLSFGIAPTAALLGWFACLARGRMPRGLRDLVAYALHYGAQSSAYLLLLTPRYPDSDPAATAAAVAEPPPAHAVGLDAGAEDPERMRLLVFFRGPLAFPHLAWLTLWSVVAVPVAIAGWLVALATGRLPAFAHRFLAARLRYATHVTAFLYLAAELFPGFTGARGAFPIDLALPPPQRQRRWTILLRGLLALPALLVAGAIGGLQALAAVLAWFAALVTGRMPSGLRGVQLLGLRYQGQVGAYLALLTADYPSSGPERRP